MCVCSINKKNDNDILSVSAKDAVSQVIIVDITLDHTTKPIAINFHEVGTRELHNNITNQ